MPVPALLAETAFQVCPQSAFKLAFPCSLQDRLPPQLAPLALHPPLPGAFLSHTLHAQSAASTAAMLPQQLSDGDRSDMTNILHGACRPLTPALIPPSELPKPSPGAATSVAHATPAPAPAPTPAPAPPADAVHWTERLCHTTFFGQCQHHKSNKYRRCENTFFCMDCADSGGLCSLCVREHSECRTLQIRRYVYRDVVKVADVAAYVDTTGIQSYTVNHAQAIFLSAKDKVPVGPYYRVDSSSRCEACKRGLRPGCTYCSLACKLSATQGMPLPAVAVHNKPPPRSRKQGKAAARCTCSDTLSDNTLSEQHKQNSDDSARSNALDAAVTSLAPDAAAVSATSDHRTARSAALVAAQRVRQSAAAVGRAAPSPDAPRKRPRLVALTADVPASGAAAATTARGRRKQHCPVRASD